MAGRKKSRDWMVGLHLALKHTAPELTLEQVAQALVDAGPLAGNRGVNYLACAMEYLEREHHQAIVDRVVSWAVRVFGPTVAYRQIFEDYRAQVSRAGIAPWSFKTFQNRARGFVTWGEVQTRVAGRLVAGDATPGAPR